MYKETKNDYDKLIYKSKKEIVTTNLMNFKNVIMGG